MNQLPLPAPPDGHSRDDMSARQLDQSGALRPGPIAPDPDTIAAFYVLEGLKGFGPQKFKELHASGVTPQRALTEPARLPAKGKRGEELRNALAAVTHEQRKEAHQRAERQIAIAERLGASIVTIQDPEYPPNVYASNNPVPVLYVRGNLSILREGKSVACVGSRGISPPYTDLLSTFARTAATSGYMVVSGFALGSDAIGHRAAWEAGGSTVAVMPGGLHQPFPPENKELWTSLLEYERAAFVSEFAFNRRASSLTLRKRNKLIVAFARGVLVAQSSAKGGAMNAFRFAMEQHKPVATFRPNGSDHTSGNTQIAAEPKANPQTFPIDSPNEDLFREWLLAL